MLGLALEAQRRRRRSRRRRLPSMSAADDLGRAVAVEVADGDRGEDRAVEASASTSPLVKARPPVCSGSGSPRTGQPGSSVPSRPHRVHEAVGGAEDQLVAVVAVEVGEQRRGRAVARSACFGKPGSRSWSRCRYRLRRSSPRERRARPVGSSRRPCTVNPYGSVFGRPLKLRRPGRRLAAVEAPGVGGEPGLQRCRSRIAPATPLERARVRRAVAPGRLHGA